MALVLADRVKETTTTTGQGTITLAGAATGFRSFSTIGNGNTTYYTIAGQSTSEWEVGIGTYTASGTTLSRDTVLSSSAGGTTKTTFSAGTKDVFVTYPAERSVYSNGTNIVPDNAAVLDFANGGTGQTSRQNAMDALAGAVTSGQYLRGNGTDVVMSAIQAADVPTLNQNTTGSAATVTGNATGSTFGFNSGYGSVVTAYGCRAWVNFNGTGTVAIRNSGNVSSITDNGTGNYTINFTTAMPDANHATIVSGRKTSGLVSAPCLRIGGTYSASAVQVALTDTANYQDADYYTCCVFR
jgi:hypothetical protein